MPVDVGRFGVKSSSLSFEKKSESRGFCPTGSGGGIDNSCGKSAGSGGGPSVDYEGASVVSSSKEINATPMNHYTTADASDSIKSEGFRYSDNSMYGKGVYFTDSDKSAYGSGDRSGAKVQVTLKPHNQLRVERDTDVPRVVEKITGKPFYSPTTREDLVTAGFGSIRFGMDNETYTVVLDKDLIKIKD